MEVQHKKHHTNEEWQKFLKESEVHRNNLIDRTSTVTKTRKPYGIEIELRFNPKYFLLPYDEVVELWDVSGEGAHVTKYKTDAWFYPFCTIASTKYKYHPAYKNLCPVLHNAHHNPITLKDSDGLLKASYIKRITTQRYKNGDVSVKIYTTVAVKEGTTLTLTAHDNYRLILPVKGQKLLEVNGCLTTKAVDFANCFEALTTQFLYKKGYSLHKDYKVIHRLIDDHLLQWFADKRLYTNDQSLSELIVERMNSVQSNPLLYDLPFTEVQLLNLYNKQRFAFAHREEVAADFIETITDYLKDGDTVSATAACYYGNNYPASIKKLMLKSDPLEFSKQSYDAISACIDRVGVDKTRMFITDVHNDGSPDYFILKRHLLLKALSFGWNISIIKDLQKLPVSKHSRRQLASKIRLIADSVHMQQSLLEQGITLNIPSKNLKEVHDYLSPIYTVYRKAESSAEVSALESVDTSEQLLAFTTNDYVVRSPFTASELMDVGSQMRHCVAAYADRFYYRQIEIAVLTDTDGEYLVCLEIYGNSVVQAKMKFNKPVSQNKEYLAVVMDFITLNNLKAATADIDGRYHSYKYDYSAPRDQSRVDIVTAIREQAAAESNPDAAVA